MRERPTGEELLETARILLFDQVLPALAPETRHAALMIGNAMAIAARELRDGEFPEREELESLLELGLAPPRDATRAALPMGEQLATLNRALCEALRQGETDSGERRAVVHRHLLAVARARVLRSNPKYLAGSR